MGVITDFLSSIARTPENKMARRELEAIEDMDAPAGFEGRPGWAILKVLGLTNKSLPPNPGRLLGHAKQDIDYDQAPISPDTARVIARQIALDDSLAGQERDVLIHLDLVDSVSAPSNLSWEPCVLSVNDYVHRWSADEQGLNNNDNVSTVYDGGSGGNNLVATVSQEPTFITGAFGNLPGFRFVRSGDGALSSVSNVNIFPNRRGTFVWLGAVKQAFDFSAKIMTNVGGNDDQLVFTDSSDVTNAVRSGNDTDGVVVLDPGAPNELPQNNPQLIVWMRDSDTSWRFRRNGLEKTTGAISNYTPVSGTFSCGFTSGGASSLALNHDVGLILSYDRVLSAEEIDTLETELAACFNVALETPIE